MNIVALIPARGGSKRIPGKNMKPLGGKPLIQWTIEAAHESGVFSSIVVSTEDLSIFNWLMNNHDNRFFVHDRPAKYAQDDSPDIYWVASALNHKGAGDIDAFAILRPTSPFRTADTINFAVKRFQDTPCSSMRAVEPVRQHPGKMWQLAGTQIHQLVENWPHPQGVAQHPGSVPWHSMPTQSLPKVYVQNSSLEIAWTWCVTVFDSISGPKVAPFFTVGWEGFSIDYPEDWDRAERHLADLQAAAATQ